MRKKFLHGPTVSLEANIVILEQVHKQTFNVIKHHVTFRRHLHNKCYMLSTFRSVCGVYSYPQPYPFPNPTNIPSLYYDVIIIILFICYVFTKLYVSTFISFLNLHFFFKCKSTSPHEIQLKQYKYTIIREKNYISFAFVLILYIVCSCMYEHIFIIK